MKKINVGILGATGSVGQKFVELLENHPWFNIHELGASSKSAGKPYSEAVNWIMQKPLNEKSGKLIVKECKPDYKSKLIFSALDSSVAGEIETEFANKGYIIISNARNHRMDKDVPLVIPEVNPEHLELIKTQKYNGGAIITNPNCSTIGLVLALKPLHDKFGIESLNVVTMQALSGAGYPGISSLDIIDNVIPYISGEEEKIITEPLKILGKLNGSEIAEKKILIDAQCNRVQVIDGHLESVQLTLKKKATKAEIIDALSNYKSLPQELNLPSAPVNPIVYFDDDKFPQPKIHRNLGNGMTVSVGRLKENKLFDFGFNVLSHNTIRGAAGGTILISELLVEKNYFQFD